MGSQHVFVLTLLSSAVHSHGSRTPAMSPKEAADVLNKQYMGLKYWFDLNQTLHIDEKSPLGVTISWAAAPDDFDKNIFCHGLVNTSCFGGFADCRMSASLYNWKMLATNYIVNPVFGRSTGYVFNQTMVENVVGKCSYIFDGATENRLNNGCGLGAGTNCSSNTSAYADICPSTGKICTANDVEVKGSICKPFGPAAVPNSSAEYQCFFSGPALNYPKHDQPNHMLGMVYARFENELKTQDYKSDNEVVIDERLLIPALLHDPAAVIPAFVFSKSQAWGRETAEKLRLTFCTKYNVTHACPPVIGVNDASDFRPNGPFFAPNGTASALLI